MHPEQSSWFAIHVRAKFEKIVTAGFRRKGFEAFLPTCQPQRELSGQPHCETPLFPNYVFCRVPAAELRSLLMIPGVMQIAGTAAGAKPVSERELDTIRQVVQTARYYQPCPFRETGRKVRVAGGALHNLEGILDEGNHLEDRIIVGISLLRLGVLVEIEDADRVVPVSNTRAAGSDFQDEITRFIPATVIFDSSRQASFAGLRGAADPTKSLVLQTQDFDILLQIAGEQERRQILGQILSRGPKHFAEARVYLLRNGEKLQATTADTLGEFNFSQVPAGALNLQVELPSLTITGALNS